VTIGVGFTVAAVLSADPGRPATEIPIPMGTTVADRKGKRVARRNSHPGESLGFTGRPVSSDSFCMYRWACGTERSLNSKKLTSCSSQCWTLSGTSSRLPLVRCSRPHNETYRRSS